MRNAINISLQAGFHAFEVESDCLKLVQQLQRRKVEPSAFGVILYDILQLAKRCSYISFSHVRREANVVAHSLAKLSKDFNEFRVWLEKYPPQIHGHVLMNVSSFSI
ncbi:Cardiolipin synthase A [Bienertia sinuspersici]